MVEENLKPRRGRRVTIDLTPAAAEEVEQIAELVGTSVPDLFRQSFSLFRLYVNAKREGEYLAVISKDNPSRIRQLELALPNQIKQVD